MRRSDEFEDIVRAIRRGGIDALVVSGNQGDQVLVLEGSEHPYRVLVESLSDGAATLDSAGNVLYANDRFAEILGVPREQLVGARLADRLPWDGSGDLARMIGGNSSGDTVLRTNGEPQRTFRFAVSPLKMKGSVEGTACVIATELTDMVKITSALKSSQTSLEELSARLLSLQDEERRRIARDLHDITGQTLAVQSMMLNQLLEQQSQFSPDVRELLSECALLNERITDEVRTLSYLLHPPLLEELGLAPAIAWYVEGLSARSGIKISVEAASDFPRLSPAVEIALFRIVQESLTNVHRYSGSSRARVTLRHMETSVTLEVKDFGKGIGSDVPDSQSPKAALGVGIQGMRERLRQLSGTLEIVSSPNEGTRVIAHLPLSRAEIGSDGLSSAPDSGPNSRKPSGKTTAANSSR